MGEASTPANNSVFGKLKAEKQKGTKDLLKNGTSIVSESC